VLKSKPDGSCVYLGDQGCSIYERRPQMCRAFDCRLMVKGMLESGGKIPLYSWHPCIGAGLSRLASL
jgi:Fe-S-cluster containining protein